MAFTHGSEGKVSIGGTIITTYVDSVDWTYSIDSHDVTVFGKNAHDKLGGLYDGSITIGGTFDNSSGTTNLETVLKPGSTNVTFVYWDGNIRRTVDVLKQSYGLSAPVADMVKWTASLEMCSTVAVSTSSTGL